MRRSKSWSARFCRSTRRTSTRTARSTPSRPPSAPGRKSATRRSSSLTATIRSGGLAVVKAYRIQAVLRALTDDTGRVDLPDLRRMRRKRAVELLTRLPGVGRKTAACVLLFGSHVPALPVDTHVHRVALRLGLVPPRTSPDATTDALEAALPPSDYFAFHVNLIRLGREICKAPARAAKRARCASVVPRGTLDRAKRRGGCNRPAGRCGSAAVRRRTRGRGAAR